MKISKNKKQNNGFSLIELIVVVAIVAVLASLVGVATIKGIGRAKKMAAGADVNRLVLGIEAYQRDYNGLFPDLLGGGSGLNVDSGDVSFVLDGTGDGAILVQALLGEPDNDLNPKEVNYIRGAKFSDGDGEPGIDATTYAFLDPWGNPYQIVWDANFDGQVSHPLDADEASLGRPVIAVSQGLSEEELGAGFTSSERHKIVTSWD